MALPQPVPSARITHARAWRHWQAGEQHARQRQWHAAAAAYAQAAQLHDEQVFALAASDALLRSGRPVEAGARAQALRRRHPDQLTAYVLEARALQAQARFDAALQCMRELPAHVVADLPFLRTLAGLLQHHGLHAEATEVLLRALALKMHDAVLHYQLNGVFRARGMKAEAAECLRTALLLGLGASELAARGQLVFMEREACRWSRSREELTLLRGKLAELKPGTAQETDPFTHAVIVGDAAEQLQVARHYALHAARDVRVLPKIKPRQQEGERLRVAYLSADFHSHATSQLLVQVLECHDRERFEIFCISTGRDDASALRGRVVAAAEHFENLQGWSHERIALRVRELRIHILVDLKGATCDTLMPVLAHRAAPLQISWLGFPGSSGAPYIDYIVGDSIVTPLAHAAHFSEKIAQLPLCYQPNDTQRARAQPSSRSDWGLPEDAVVLCGFHQAYKISEEVFDCWCTLLEQRADAVLWLLEWNANVQANLLTAAVARGIDKQRLIFAPLLAVQQHLSRLAHADVFLDTWPCNAHTTASEALWVGVPVVTVQGEAFAQRVAASLLHAVQLDELVCGDAAGYHDLVLALIDDAPRRAALRAHLAGQQQTSALFDGANLARDLEALLQRMWQRALRGQAPQHLAGCRSGG